MKPSLPPHIAWPLFVVLLLLFGVGTTFGVLVAARSDGGAQVMDDYYRKAVAWDSLNARKQASDALGWQVHLELERADDPAERILTLRFTDRDGQPLNGLTGTVHLLHPALARPVADLPLQAATRPGHYRMAVPIDRPGLWDIALDIHQGGRHYQHQVRREVLP